MNKIFRKKIDKLITIFIIETVDLTIVVKFNINSTGNEKKL